MKKRAILLILLSAVFWGCTGPYVRVLSGWGLGPREIAAVRCLSSGSIMIAGLLVWKPKELKVYRTDWWIFAGTGILSVTFYYCCYFTTILLTSLSVAAVLLYTSPVFVMILSALFFKESLNLQKAVALVMTLMGGICASGVLTGMAGMPLLGLFIGLCSGLGYALYSIFSRVALNRGYSSFTITSYTMLLAGGSLWLISDKKVLMQCFQSRNGMEIFFLVVVSLVVTLVPFLCYTTGLKEIETGKAAVIAAVEPVAASILGILFYDEEMTWGIFAGLCLVLGGVLLLYTDFSGSENKSKRERRLEK